MTFESKIYFENINTESNKANAFAFIFNAQRMKTK